MDEISGDGIIVIDGEKNRSGLLLAHDFTGARRHDRRRIHYGLRDRDEEGEKSQVRQASSCGRPDSNDPLRRRPQRGSLGSSYKDVTSRANARLIPIINWKHVRVRGARRGRCCRRFPGNALMIGACGADKEDQGGPSPPERNAWRSFVVLFPRKVSERVMYPWPIGDFDYKMDAALDIAMDYLEHTGHAVMFLETQRVAASAIVAAWKGGVRQSHLVLASRARRSLRNGRYSTHHPTPRWTAPITCANSSVPTWSTSL